MKIKEHKIDSDHVSIDEIDKTSGSFEEGLPDTIVIHYTAGPSVSSAVNTFKDPSVEASAHVVIDHDGSITQLIPFNKIGWHAGESSWLDRTDLNNYSIGIEIVNAGRLEKTGSVWRSWFGKTYSEDDVLRAVHRNEEEESWWHVYTEKQITATHDLCRNIMNAYNIKHILGHEEIAPGRKSDPGPAFPLDKLRNRLLHSNRKDQGEDDADKKTGVVTASALNIRSGPSSSTSTIAKPLSKNTKVSILKEQNGWYNVEVKLRGWVFKEYIHNTE
ncbi:N-acetylmuramoyl-L-alanine amidase [Rhodohalobacter sp. 8-1]|uniref:N-acetylmuramoyl-L-alanine amidase n=1 Tax=Rhodohalobacter sp. 8-1 TaxID=3131972 RepID=UPI0030EC9BC6